MENAFYKAVGAKVREARDRAGMIQAELGAASGINRLYVGRVENGMQNASLLTIGRLARALNVTPATFFEGITLDGTGAEPGSAEADSRPEDVGA
ncbi:helix-turn-helix domain-containing protein [Sphingosinicellaceae bacterium]|nr:helix-turn-helix domain-containing protein [Sphingosinicellaceae bacterium]